MKFLHDLSKEQLIEYIWQKRCDESDEGASCSYFNTPSGQDTEACKKCKRFEQEDEGELCKYILIRNGHGSCEIAVQSGKDSLV